MDIIIIFDIEMSNEYMSNEQINVHSTYACPKIDIIMSNQDLFQIDE
jgi:hypothetical protein